MTEQNPEKVTETEKVEVERETEFVEPTEGQDPDGHETHETDDGDDADDSDDDGAA